MNSAPSTPPSAAETRRASLSGQYRRAHDSYSNTWSAYVIDYRLQLWSNFTYFLDNPEQGDQFEQLDDRTIWGGSWQFSAGAADARLRHRLGTQLRYDKIGDVGLFSTREPAAPGHRAAGQCG